MLIPCRRAPLGPKHPQQYTDFTSSCFLIHSTKGSCRKVSSTFMSESLFTLNTFITTPQTSCYKYIRGWIKILYLLAGSYKTHRKSSLVSTNTHSIHKIRSKAKWNSLRNSQWLPLPKIAIQGDYLITKLSKWQLSIQIYPAFKIELVWIATNKYK